MMLHGFLATAALLLLGMVPHVACKSPIFVGYYSSWKQAQTAGVDFAKYTHLNIAFAIPKDDGSITFDDSFSLPNAVKAIHGSNAKALLSVGGWTGSNLFSPIIKDATKSATFLASMVSLIKTNDLDGIDLDWEYPGKQGNICNVFDKDNDTPSYLKFLQQLRKKLDAEFGAGKKLITMAVGVAPFEVGGTPSADVSEFAKVVDYAHLMLYDINGIWNDVTGPNAPMDFVQGKGMQASFKSGITAWKVAKWPAEQLTAGIAFYGRSTTATADMSTDPKNQYQPQSKAIPQGDKEDASWTDTCAGTTSLSGQWQWKHLRDQGLLSSPDTAASGWTRYWDDVSQTPWLFNPSTKIYISYDDPKSLKAKVSYAAQQGLAGAMVWTINMDYNGELLDALRTWPDTPSISHTSEAPCGDGPDEVACSPKSDDSSQSSDDSSSDSGDNATAVEADGERCTENGKLTCVSPGAAPGYGVCNHDTVVIMQCAPGTVCYAVSGSILCAVKGSQPV